MAKTFSWVSQRRGRSGEFVHTSRRRDSTDDERGGECLEKKFTVR